MCTDVVGCHCPGRSEGNRTSKNPPSPLLEQLRQLSPGTSIRHKRKTNTLEIMTVWPFFSPKSQNPCPNVHGKYWLFPSNPYPLTFGGVAVDFQTRFSQFSKKPHTQSDELAFKLSGGNLHWKYMKKGKLCTFCLKMYSTKQTNRLVEEQGWTCGRIYV